MRAALLKLVLTVAVAACSVPGSPTQSEDNPRTPGQDATAPNVQRLTAAAPFANCIGGDAVLAAFALADGPAFWTLFPTPGMAPELEEVVDRPLRLVVYRDGWPGATSHRVVEGVGEYDSQPDPGTWDVCVETADGSYTIAGEPYVVYANIPQQGSLVLSGE